MLLVIAAPAHAQVGEYTPCEKTGDALIVEVSGAPCDAARAVAAALTDVPAAGVEAVLRAQGWAPVRATATRFEESYELFAVRGRAGLWIRRRGDAPDIDSWTAGRELLFSRAALVALAQPSEATSVCTSAFLVRLGGRLAGLSAGHCAGLTKQRTTLRRNSALRDTGEVSLVLGLVRRNLWRTRRFDALAVPVPSGPGRPSEPVVDRGILAAPLFVRGRALPKLGRLVCFSGRASGVDRCGRIIRSYPGTGGLPCTTITAEPGDSGAPVYTAPAADSTVRAVGIATLVFGQLQSMCFTPLGPVLAALNATLVTATGAS